MMQSDEPPRENPMLAAYEKFQAETPLVTRYTLTTLLLSYVLSFFWDPTIALSAIPIFILKLQLYRLITSPLICTSGLNLVFAFFSMTYYGKKLEYSMGSTSFAMLILIFGGLTNLIYVHVCFAACLITDNASWLTSPSHGFWMVLLGLISLEASMAPPGSTRRLLTLEIPNLCYPLVLLGIFALLSGGGDGIPLSYFISTALGYGLGFGKLDRLKLGHERRTRWEASILRNFTSRQGWVVGPSGNEWHVENNNANANTNANTNASTSSGGNQVRTSFIKSCCDDLYLFRLIRPILVEYERINIPQLFFEEETLQKHNPYHLLQVQRDKYLERAVIVVVVLPAGRFEEWVSQVLHQHKLWIDRHFWRRQKGEQLLQLPIPKKCQKNLSDCFY
jgi:membrane associated rhomboid family serine protease